MVSLNTLIKDRLIARDVHRSCIYLPVNFAEFQDNDDPIYYRGDFPIPPCLSKWQQPTLRHLNDAISVLSNGLTEAPHYESNASTIDWTVEYDTANIDDMSDLFTIIEHEQSLEKDACAVDEVMELFETCEENVDDAHAAVVVDELNEMFDMLEGSEDFVLEDQDNGHEAAFVDEIADLFDSLDDTVLTETDAAAVDAVVDYFDTLEQSAADEADAMVVDDFSTMFDMLESMSTSRVVSVPSVAIDSRIPQIKHVPQMNTFRMGVVGDLVCGPPRAVKELTREERVCRWKEKRRCRAKQQAMTKVVFASRQQVAAKRRRVNGRFAGLETQFVSVSAFQS
ncbi:hypothetical protein Ae201684P_019189 [Aphanomyces euteiches]|nr:hypothetical protein Ae201684P_019189 [Aphanomyces euteiches]